MLEPLLDTRNTRLDTHRQLITREEDALAKKLGRPRKYKQELERTTVRLPRAVIKRGKTYGTDHGKSFNEVVIFAMQRLLGEQS